MIFIFYIPQTEQLVEVHSRPVEGHQSIGHNEGNLPVQTHTLLQSTEQEKMICHIIYGGQEDIIILLVHCSTSKDP